VIRPLLAALAGCSVSLGALAKTCDKDFGVFLKRFEADRVFQESHIHFPLSYVGRDETQCYPDCPISEHALKVEHVRSQTDPIYPLVALQKKMQLVGQIDVKGKSAVVHLVRPESDAYAFEFRFAFVRSCWSLTYVHDRSL